ELVADAAAIEITDPCGLDLGSVRLQLDLDLGRGQLREYVGGHLRRQRLMEDVQVRQQPAAGGTKVEGDDLDALLDQCLKLLERVRLTERWILVDHRLEGRVHRLRIHVDRAPRRRDSHAEPIRGACDRRPTCREWAPGRRRRRRRRWGRAGYWRRAR